ncbi:MAG: type VII secretion protein EccE [Rhodococcus sp.]|nr:type VII secretion protein EccE [Rhodococcus sp. (in: high G+C Gram-positive bacteria)]
MIKLTEWTAIGSVVTVTGALLAIGTLPGDSPARPAIATVAALVVLALVFAPGGLTVVDRFHRRRRFARPRRLVSLLYSTLRCGTVWDGQTVSMFVALRPLPFSVSVVGANETGVESRPLPLDLIRDHLVQGDVNLAGIRIISHGYRTHRESPYGQAYTSLRGDTAMPDTLSTVIEIRVNLAKSYQSVLARATNGSVPTGVGNAARIVSARLERQLNIAGYSATLLKPNAIRKFHDAVLAPLNDGFKDERWTHLGGTLPTVTAAPAEWSELAVERWLGVPADRMAYVVEIGNDRHQNTSVGMTVAYSYDQVTKMPARSLRLRPNDGAHGDHATALLPLAQTVATPAPSLTVRDGADFPVTLPAFGLGVYLGPANDGSGRVFLNTETGGEVLWLETPEAFAHQLAARITTTGARVGIFTDSPHWAALAGNVPGMRLRPKGADVAIYEGQPPSQFPMSTAILVWAPNGAPRGATHRVTADDSGVMTLISRTSRVRFDWEAPHAELPFITSLAG